MNSKVYNRLMIKLIFLAFLAVFTTAIPFEDQILLANSLIVSKDDFADLYNWECKVCDSTNKPVHTHPIEDTSIDVKCIISVYSDSIVLAFRYTNTALNVWQDILYPLQVKDEHTCSNCKVQKAYNTMWGKIRDEVYADLRALKQETGIKKLYITGISLGGGLAVLAFIDINHENIFDIVKVTTFGAPRVGNKHWAAHFDLITLGITKRYIVSGDPIVVMPRCLTLLCTYRQTGIKIVCDDKTNLCTQEEEIPDDDDEVHYGSKMLSSAITRLNAHRGDNLNSIIDHINGYPDIYNMTLILG